MSPSGTSRRQQFESRQRRRSTVIAAVSTAVAVALVVLLVPRIPGWDRVRASFFDGHTFSETFPKLPGRFWYDIQIFLICTPCILALGLLIAFARNARTPALYPLRLFATIYTDVMRGVPMILWITIIGFGVPGLIQNRTWGKAVVWAGVALVVAYAAYVARSSAPVSRVSTRANAPRPARSGSRRARPCSTSYCPKRCDEWCPPS